MIVQVLKELEHRDFRNLDRLIEERGMEVFCPHCKIMSIQALGWLRDLPEMDCSTCHELIILDTADIRASIRSTDRQLRDLSEQLHGQVTSWT